MSLTLRQGGKGGHAHRFLDLRLDPANPDDVREAIRVFSEVNAELDRLRRARTHKMCPVNNTKRDYCSGCDDRVPGHRLQDVEETITQLEAEATPFRNFFREVRTARQT